MPLGIPHPVAPQLLQNGFALYLFSDRGDAHDSSDLVDGLHERAVHGVVGHAPDVVPADLDVVDRQCLEVGERGQAVAEVVQPDAAPRRLISATILAASGITKSTSTMSGGASVRRVKISS